MGIKKISCIVVGTFWKVTSKQREGTQEQSILANSMSNSEREKNNCHTNRPPQIPISGAINFVGQFVPAV